MSLKKQKYLPWPFNYAKNWYGVELFESDLKYINNVIISDKIYRLIAQAHKINTSFVVTTMDPESYNDPKVISTEEGVLRDLIEMGNAINFFKKFLDDDKCPNRVKYFLWQWIGNQFGYVKVAEAYDALKQRMFLIERWQEICR